MKSIKLLCYLLFFITDAIEADFNEKKLIRLDMGKFETTEGKKLVVYNGEKTNYKQHKHLVQLDIKVFAKNKASSEYTGMCSGSVIGKSWVLSAAHCVQIDEHYRYHIYVVRVEDGQWSTLGKVIRRNTIVHPDYIHNDMDVKPESDLLLMKTTIPMELNENLKAIPLNKVILRRGKSTPAIIAGYGDILPGVRATTPRQGTVTIYACDKSYGIKLLCSSGSVMAGSGDSGGPLILKNGKLAGVTSSGCDDPETCETIYVEVAAYVDWIKNKTGIH